MKLKRLKEIIKDVDNDEIEIFIRDSINPCGNIGSLEQIEVSTYGSFGESVPCIILNTEYSKVIEENTKEEYIDFIKENCK